jgi:hypothetical protein
LLCLIGQGNRTCRVAPARATSEVPKALGRPLSPPAAPVLPNGRGLWRHAVPLSWCREGWWRPNARRTARWMGGGGAGRGACGNGGSCPRQETAVRAHPRIATQHGNRYLATQHLRYGSWPGDGAWQHGSWPGDGARILAGDGTCLGRSGPAGGGGSIDAQVSSSGEVGDARLTSGCVRRGCARGMGKARVGRFMPRDCWIEWNSVWCTHVFYRTVWFHKLC